MCVWGGGGEGSLTFLSPNDVCVGVGGGGGVETISGQTGVES